MAQCVSEDGGIALQRTRRRRGGLRHGTSAVRRGVGGRHLRVRLDEKGDQEDNGDEETQDDGEERAEVDVKANSPTVDRDDARHLGGHLVHDREVQRHLRCSLRHGELAAGAERRLRHEGLDRSSKAKSKEQLCKQSAERHSATMKGLCRGGGAAGRR